MPVHVRSLSAYTTRGLDNGQEPHVDYERLAELPPGQQALVQELAHVLVVHVSVNFYERLQILFKT